MKGESASRPVVFLGPSLSRDRARQILDADYRPPVRSGDLVEISIPTNVVIIDGDFGESITLSSLEAWHAAHRGLHLFGAASTGAKLAAELPHLMAGVGWVYQAFAEKRVCSMDDIAVLYSPDSLAPLTVPVVTILHWLECLVRAAQIDDKTADNAIAIVRAIPLVERHIDTVRTKLAAFFGEPALARLLATSGGTFGNVKAEDAALALQSVANLNV